MIITSQVVI